MDLILWNGFANCAIGMWNQMNMVFANALFQCNDFWLFDPLCKAMEYENQQCLELLLLELKRRKEKLHSKFMKATVSYN